MNIRKICGKIWEMIFESLFPIVIVLIAIIVSFEPQIGNFVFDINNIILSFFLYWQLIQFWINIKQKNELLTK